MTIPIFNPSDFPLWIHDLTGLMYQKGFAIPTCLDQTIRDMFHKNLSPDMAAIELQVKHISDLIKTTAQGRH